MSYEVKPMRSLIFVDLAREEYRHRLLHWLIYHHVQDSISQFGPYVTKYAFYPALPVPPDGDRFGTCKMQLTEHYWLMSPFAPEAKVKALTEFFPIDVLRWQGNMPDAGPELDGEEMDADTARATDSGEARPFLFAFVPIWWEDDLKGSDRTRMDGPNYRWQWAIRLPEGVSAEECDRWLYNDVFPLFQETPECTRILTSKVMQEVNGCQYYRVMEMWFDGPDEWHRVAVDKAVDIPKPAWAQTFAFPYLRPVHNIQSLFVPDVAYSDNMTQHRGWITMR